MRESTKEFFKSIFVELDTEEQLKIKIIEQEDEIISLKTCLEGKVPPINKDFSRVFYIFYNKIEIVQKERDEYKSMLDERDEIIKLHDSEVKYLEKQLARAVHFMNMYKNFSDYYQELYEEFKKQQ